MRRMWSTSISIVKILERFSVLIYKQLPYYGNNPLERHVVLAVDKIVRIPWKNSLRKIANPTVHIEELELDSVGGQ